MTSLNKISFLKLKALMCFVLLLGFSRINAQESLDADILNSKIPYSKSDSYVFPNLNLAGNDDPTYSVTRYDFVVTLRDGVFIDCSKFIPDVSAPAGGWAAIIFCHGLGARKQSMFQNALSAAQDGYYTFVFSMRGHGNSGGTSYLMSEVEMQDLMEIVNYVKNDAPVVDPNNVAIMGGAQGGIVPFMAACNGLDVKCIVADLTSPQFATDWVENGNYKMSLVKSLTMDPDSLRLGRTATQYLGWTMSKMQDKYDSLATELPKKRDFKNKLSGNTTPIMFNSSWYDVYSDPASLLTVTNDMSNASYSIYMGAVTGHGVNAPQTEVFFYTGKTKGWLKKYLKTGTQSSFRKLYSASSSYPVINDAWSYTKDSSLVQWPPVTSNLRLNFAKNGKLQANPVTNSDKIQVDNMINDPYLTMQDCINWSFTGTTFSSKFVKDSFTFTSDPLTSDKKLNGAPVINLNYSSTATDACQFDFQIYDVAPDGTSEFVSRVDFTDRDYIKGKIKMANIIGDAYSHIFKAGDKIRIVLTNLDVNPDDKVLGTNPYVLPVLSRGTHNMFMKNSYVDFPMQNVSSRPLAANNTSTDNGSFKLGTNFPNPFNPSTKIKFEIPSSFSGLVTLKIYDGLGREVATLVNDNLPAGIHEAEFNGVNLSSGIYYYKLQAGTFNDVKKMLLVK
jgi:predicted acyl esterase